MIEETPTLANEYAVIVGAAIRGYGRREMKVTTVPLTPIVTSGWRQACIKTHHSEIGREESR
jgi:hypothetical protein